MFRRKYFPEISVSFNFRFLKDIKSTHVAIDLLTVEVEKTYFCIYRKLSENGLPTFLTVRKSIWKRNETRLRSLPDRQAWNL